MLIPSLFNKFRIKKNYKTPIFSILLFSLSLTAYLYNDNYYSVSNDQRGNIITALNLVINKTFLINPYEFKSDFKLVKLLKNGISRYGISPRSYFLTKSPKHNGFLSNYGYGTPLTAAPFYYLSSYFFDIKNSIKNQYIIAKFTASILTALSVVIMFHCLNFISTLKVSLLLTFIFAFCTNIWSTCSQELWQHTASIFYITLFLYFFLKQEYCAPKTSNVIMLSSMLGMAFLCRQTNAVIFIFIFIYYLKNKDRSILVALALPFSVFALTFFLFNLHYYENPIFNGQVFATKIVTGYAWKVPNAFNILFSPSRGLFIFSPILIFSLIGVYNSFKRGKPLFPISISSITIIIIYSSWVQWWGGWCFGYRIIVDIIPLLIILMVPSIEIVIKSRILLILFIFFTIYSIFIQILGSFCYTYGTWENKNCIDMGTNSGSHRRWTIYDSQIIYLIENLKNEYWKKQKLNN